MEGARIALADDIEECGRLLDAAFTYACTTRGGPELVAEIQDHLPRPCDAGSAASWWSAQPDHVLLAGTFDQAVVGVAIAHHFCRGSVRIGIVDCLFVDPDARGVGVGGALGEALLRWCDEQGCSTLDAPALPGDRETKQLLETLGFSARRVLLRRRIDLRAARLVDGAAGEEERGDREASPARE